MSSLRTQIWITRYGFARSLCTAGRIPISTPLKSSKHVRQLQRLGFNGQCVEGSVTEFDRALQFTVHVHGGEIQEAQPNPSDGLILEKRVVRFLEGTNQIELLGLVSSRLLEQLCYRPDILNAAEYQAIISSIPDKEMSDSIGLVDSSVLIGRHCEHIHA